MNASERMPARMSVSAVPFTTLGTSDIAVPGRTLRDWGLYTQLLYRFAPTWRAGVRFEHATGSGDNWDPESRTPTGRASDPFRDDRYRVSPLVQWQASHFSRIRLQYNYDDAEHLEDGDAHSIWLGFEVALGDHAAHKF